MTGPWDDFPRADRAPSLAAARGYSLDCVARAQVALTAHADTLDAIETVAAAGSLGRLEATPGSDFDCVVVARPGADGARVAAQTSRVITLLEATGLKPPKAGGIYRQAVAREALLDEAALGSLEEPAAVFGKRMALLLDARPLFREAACRSLQQAVLRWYGHGFHAADPGRGWTYLLNDLVRYVHAYAAWQQYAFSAGGDDSWWLRQAKLRTSRCLTFAGLMVLLGASHARPDKHAWLCERLALTPLQRVADSMSRHDPSALAELVTIYDSLHARLADARFRARLVAGGPRAADAPTVDDPAGWPALADDSATFMRILSGYLLDRRADWHPDFFARLIL